MWNKIWEWIKKYGLIIVGAFGVAIGFLIGRRKSVSEFDGMVGKLRDEIELLGSELSKLRGDNTKLRNLNQYDREQLESIESELNKTREYIRSTKFQIGEGRELTDEIRSDLGQFRRILDKHRKGLENIKVEGEITL